MATMMVGTQEVQKIMYGTEELTTLAIGDWSFPVGGDDYASKPFTVEVLNHASGSSAGTITLTPSSSALYRTLWYSKNGGEATRLDFGGTTTAKSIPVTFGDKIEFAVQTDQNGSAESESAFIKINSSDEYFKVYGNIMSLAFVDFQSATTTPSNYCFSKLFNSASTLVDAENLVLPAETITYGCYSFMFYFCDNLVKSPKILPALSLEPACYQTMFFGCTSLESAPELPATTLANSCYSNMFRNCSSLNTAPELPASNLVSSCYYNMFNNSGVNYIKCLATTNIGVSQSTYSWTTDVGANGTFVKKRGTTWGTGSSGIPSGWTVEEVD